MKGSRSSAVTASATVAKLSSTYWAQAAMLRPGLAPSNLGYSDLHQPEQVDVEARLVEAVGGRDVIARGDHAAVFRGPADRVRPDLAAALHAVREDPEIGGDVALPVHGSGGEHGVALAEIDQARAGLRRGRGGQQAARASARTRMAGAIDRRGMAVSSVRLASLRRDRPLADPGRPWGGVPPATTIGCGQRTSR